MSHNMVTLSNVLSVVSQRVGAPGLRKLGLANKDLPSEDDEDKDYIPISSKEATTESSKGKKRKRVENATKRGATKRERDERKTKRKRKARRKIRMESWLDSVNPESIQENIIETTEDKDYIPMDGKKKKVKHSKDKGNRKIVIEKEGETNINPTSDQWAKLPIEILSRIFRLITASDSKGVRFVCRSSQVCRDWHLTAISEVSWRYIDLSFLASKFHDSSADDILQKLTQNVLGEVRSVNISGWSGLTAKGLTSISEGCRRLVALDISSCQNKRVSKLSTESFLEIAEQCVELRQFKASNLRIATNHNKTMEEFLRIRGQSLVHLNFSNNVAFSSQSLRAIIENCPLVACLDCSNTSVRSIILKEFQLKCPLLTELYLANLPLEVKDKKSNIKECPGFQHLELASFATAPGRSWLTDILLHALLKSSTNLKTLDIRGASRVVDFDMSIASEVIERLYLSHCIIDSDVAESINGRWSETLWDLDVSKCEIADVSEFVRTLFPSDVPSCTNILHLDISHCDISDSDLPLILKTCKELKTLDLTCCRGMSRGLKRLYKGAEDLCKLNYAIFFSQQ